MMGQWSFHLEWARWYWKDICLSGYPLCEVPWWPWLNIGGYLGKLHAEAPPSLPLQSFHQFSHDQEVT